MTDLEARIAALEAQVAELMKYKAEQEKKALTLFLQSDLVERAGDVLAVFADSEFAPRGLYCRHCVENAGLFTLLPLEWDEVPSCNASPITSKCPAGDLLLKVQWENR